MSDDINLADLFPISELPERLPRLPGSATHATSKIYAWLNLANDPTRRTLKSVQVGRYRYSSDRWLREFLDGTSPITKSHMTGGHRTRQRNRVKAELAQAGI